MKLNCLLPLSCLALAPLAAGQDAPTATARPDAAEVRDAMATAAAILIANQENYANDRPVGGLPDDELAGWQEGERKRLEGVRGKAAGDGHEWPYEGVYRVRGGVIPSGYRVGGTAIVCETLLEIPGFEEDDVRREAVLRGVDFILETLSSDEQMAIGPKRGYDVRGWGHTYGLQFLLRCLERKVLSESRASAAREMIPHLILCLEKNQTSQGGWNYAGDTRVSPFMTGSTLIALYRARAQGYAVPTEMVDKALEALEHGRSSDTGAYAYAGPGDEPMHSSAARAAIAELALYRAGKSSQDGLRRAVAGFFDGWDELLKRKSQQGTHKKPYGIAPYYFFFGHTYAALAIEYLPEKERPEWRDRMLEVLWRTREGHGGWNDRIFPRTESYSTAMVVQALMAPALPSVPEWK